MNVAVTVIVLTVHAGTFGGAIFTGKDSGGSHYRFVAGHQNIFRAPISGEIWTIQGHLNIHKHPSRNRLDYPPIWVKQKSSN
jgi:hypothetical protein